MVLIGVQSNEQEFSFLNISSDLCRAIVKPLGDNFEDEVMVVSVADASNLEK